MSKEYEDDEVLEVSEIDEEEIDEEEIDDEASEVDDIEEEESQKDDSKPKKKKNKEKKQPKQNPITTYKFWFKIFGAVLLIIFGFLLLFKKDVAKSIVLIFTGGVFVLFSLVRFVPLFKKLKKPWSKVLNVAEIIIDLVIGVVLVVTAIMTFGEEQKGFIEFCSKHYNVLIGFVLWFRGFVYFICTILFGEKTDKLQFFTHIAAITAGGFFIGRKIDLEFASYVLAALAFLSALAIGIESFYDYGRFRQKEKPEEKKKSKKKKDEAKENDEDSDEDVINPGIIEPNNQNDQPYVN